MFKKNLQTGARTRRLWLPLRVTCILATLASIASGCRSIAPLPSADFSTPGWTVLQGQAVWRKDRQASEIAGDILLATNLNGQAMVQFTKSPFPLVIARTTTSAWQIEAPMDNRRFARAGSPPARVIWFQLPRALRGEALPKNWTWQADSNHWNLANESNGERLTGFLEPR